MNKFLTTLFTSFLIFSCSNNDFKIDRNEINKGIVYEVNVRQYSKEGSFKVVTNDIPKIKDLGVEILWLMPIHPIGKEKRKGGCDFHNPYQGPKTATSRHSRGTATGATARAKPPATLVRRLVPLVAQGVHCGARS